MSTFSSLSSISAASPPPSLYPRLPGGKQAQARGSRVESASCTRHARTPSSRGSSEGWQSPKSSSSSLWFAHALPRYDARFEGSDSNHGETRDVLESKSVTKVRAFAPCNEAARLFRGSGKLQAAGTQAHQVHHASSGWLPPRASPSLPRDGAISVNTTAPSSSRHLYTNTLPASPHRHRAPRRTFGNSQYAYLPPSASIASFAVSEPSPASFEPSTPSPSPRVQRSRPQRSPSTPPRTFLLSRGFAPTCGRPTLAMSMQIHAPSPVLSSSRVFSPAPPANRGRSPSRPSSSRPTSPQVLPTQLPGLRPPMPRPPSRSERLLRDTLRRAEEHDRMLSPPLPPLSPGLYPAGPLGVGARSHPSTPRSQRHRRSTSSSDSFDYPAERAEEVDTDDGDARDYLWRTASASSESSCNHAQHAQAQYAHQLHGRALVRNRSMTSADSPKNAHAIKAQAQPQIQQSPVSKRASLDAERPHSHQHQHQYAMTPHEAVLRNRLEGVLRGAKEQERRTQSVERRDGGSGSGSGSGNSMASSRNLSAEGDLFFGAVEDSSVGSADAKYPKNRTSFSPRSPRVGGALPQPSVSPSSTSGSPRTPPDSPPFDAHTAAALCRAMDGYVSFANIEGLGVPGGEEEDEESVKEHGRWWGWLTIPKRRERSDSASSFASG